MINSIWQNKLFPEDLPEDQIHVWLLDIKKITNSDKTFDNVLSPDELDKKEKYHFLKDRIVYSTSRGILRLLLSSYIDIPSQSICFDYNDYGKPFLQHSIGSNVKFNISHSKEYALLAFNLNDEIGVDIEFIDDKIVTKEIAQNYFSNREVTELFEVEPNEQTSTFFNIWTRKEAYIKAKGKGLSIPLNSFDVSQDILNPKILRSLHETNFGHLNLNNLTINEKYSGAVLNIGRRKALQLYYLSHMPFSNK